MTIGIVIGLILSFNSLSNSLEMALISLPALLTIEVIYFSIATIPSPKAQMFWKS